MLLVFYELVNILYHSSVLLITYYLMYVYLFVEVYIIFMENIVSEIMITIESRIH